MQISDKDKNPILEGFIDIFTRISSREYQKRVWINSEGPEVDDFDDTVCEFFGECDSILSEYKCFKITENQYRLLVEFRDEFRKFSTRHDLAPDFLDIPGWKKITELAEEILKAFNYIKRRK